MNSVERCTDALANDLKRVVRHSEDLIESTTEAVCEKAYLARECLAVAVRSVNDTCVELRQKTVETAIAADSLVHNYPYQSIAIGIALGLVTGIILNRK